jgi:RNA polymerase sigma-70 factor (ECF subfamily)
MEIPERKNSNEEDIEFLSTFLSGDEDGFIELMRKYKTGVYRVVMSILRDRRTTEEATEDTFFKLYEKAHTFKHKSSFKTWLFTIAVNTARNYRKKLIRRKKEISLDNSYYNLKNHNDPVKQTELRHKIDILESVIDELPERQREVFRMKYISDMKIKEIAEILSLSEGGVKASLSIALNKVREDMKLYNNGEIYG